MNLRELMVFAGRFFEEESIRYFVFGASAMNFWMPPRNTIDLDLMVFLDKRKISALTTKLNEHGFRFSKALARRFKEGQKVKLPIGDTELDLKRCRTDHDRQALERAQKFEAEGFSLWIATPEDLILYKLHYWRRLDQADIERMLQECEALDENYIEGWIEPLEEATGSPMRRRWDEIR